MTKRYQLWHIYGDAACDVNKDLHDAETLEEVMDLEGNLRTSSFDLFKLFDTAASRHHDDLWTRRHALRTEEARLAHVAACEMGVKVATQYLDDLAKLDASLDPIRKDLAKMRDPATNPATRSLLEQVSENNIRAFMSVPNICKHD